MTDETIVAVYDTAAHADAAVRDVARVDVGRGDAVAGKDERRTGDDDDRGKQQESRPEEHGIAP